MKRGCFTQNDGADGWWALMGWLSPCSKAHNTVSNAGQFAANSAGKVRFGDEGGNQHLFYLGNQLNSYLKCEWDVAFL